MATSGTIYSPAFKLVKIDAICRLFYLIALLISFNYQNLKVLKMSLEMDAICRLFSHQWFSFIIVNVLCLMLRKVRKINDWFLAHKLWGFHVGSLNNPARFFDPFLFDTVSKTPLYNYRPLHNTKYILNFSFCLSRMCLLGSQSSRME